MRRRLDRINRRLASIPTPARRSSAPIPPEDVPLVARMLGDDEEDGRLAAEEFWLRVCEREGRPTDALRAHVEQKRARRLLDDVAPPDPDPEPEPRPEPPPSVQEAVGRPPEWLRR